MIEFGINDLTGAAGGSNDTAIQVPAANVPDWIGASGSVYSVVVNGLMFYTYEDGNRNIMHWADRFALIAQGSQFLLGIGEDDDSIINVGFGGGYSIPSGEIGTLVMTYNGPSGRLDIYYESDNESNTNGRDIVDSGFDIQSNKQDIINIGGKNTMSASYNSYDSFNGVINSIGFFKDVILEQEDVAAIHEASKIDVLAGVGMYPTGKLTYPSGIDNKVSTNDEYFILPFIPMTDTTSVFDGTRIKGPLTVGDHVNVGSGIITWVNGLGNDSNGNTYGVVSQTDRWAGAEFAGGATGTPIYIDPFTHDGSSTASSDGFYVSGFYSRMYQDSFTFSVSGIAGEATAVAALVNGELPRPGYDRFLAWSNSRGMRTNDADGRTMSANHFNGYYLTNSGLFRGSINNSVISNPPTNFGFKYPDGFTTTATTLSSSTKYQDFQRLWTNLGVSNDPGPGNGSIIESGNAITILSNQEPGTLYTRDVRRTVEIVTLKFPSAGEPLFLPIYANTSNVADGFAAEPEVVASSFQGGIDSWNTSEDTFTFSSSTDFYDDVAKQFVVANLPDAANYQNGWGLYCSATISGPNREGSLFIVSGVAMNGNEATITVYQNSDNGIPTGIQAFAAGPLEFGKVSFTFESGLSNTYEYVGLFSNYTNSSPTVVYAANCWAENTSGFIGGPAGWGGNGYAPQQEAGNHPTWVSGIMTTLGVNDVILHGATQSSSPSDMYEFAAKASAVNVNPVIVIDQQHDIDEVINDTWADYVVESGNGLYPAAIAGSYLMGSAREQLVRGLKTDEAHPNIFGQTEIANLQLGVLVDFITNVTPAITLSVGLTPINRYGGKIFADQKVNVSRSAVSGPQTTRGDWVNRTLGSDVEGGVNSKLSDTEIIRDGFNVETGAFVTESASGVTYGTSDDSNAKNHEFAYRKGIQSTQDSIERN